MSFFLLFLHFFKEYVTEKRNLQVFIPFANSAAYVWLVLWYTFTQTN